MFKAVDREAGIRAFVSLWNREYPEFLNSEEEVRSGYRHLPKDAPEFHFVAYDGGEPIAALLIDSDEEEKPVKHLSGDFLVHPHRIDEVMPAGIDIIRRMLAEHRLEDISVWGSDLLPARAKALKEAGFEVSQTVEGSRLLLSEFDPAPFMAKLEAAGEKYRLVTAAELDEEGFDWIPPLWEATNEIAKDIPTTLPYCRPPIDEYRQLVRTEKVIYQTDTMMIALEGDKVVGYSRVTLSDIMPELASTGMSGAIRSHRRQGIVTALKVLGIERMKAKGIRWLQTDNDESNPMFQLNLQLGFKPCWKWELWRLSSSTGSTED